MKYPEVVIDMHTHFFNANYLPLEGILRRVPILKPFASHFAKLVAELTKSSYPNMEEIYRDLTNTSVDEESASIEAIWSLVEEELSERTGYLALRAMNDPISGSDNAARRLADDPLYQTLVEIEALYKEESNEASDTGEFAHNLFDSLWALEAHPDVRKLSTRSKPKLRRFKRSVEWMLRKISSNPPEVLWEKGINFLQFAYNLLKPEREMVEVLRKSYGNAHKMIFIHHMMDMEKGYGYKPVYEYLSDQLPRMERLDADYSGLIHGFVAFDPRREDWKQLLDKVKSGKFLGFKFYPGMGYRPSGSEGLVGKRVDEFFSVCAENGYPIFTHCTPVGVEAEAGFGLNGHPDLWYPVLSNHKNLRLCFGHAGGGAMKNGNLYSYGWYSSTDAQWRDGSNFARKVVELCSKYENVYAEFGYLHEILEAGHVSQVFKANLIKVFRDGVEGGNYPTAGKLMYGSDWHMPHMVDGAGQYLAHFENLFQDPVLSPYASGFFCGNALAYLNRDFDVPLARVFPRSGVAATA